MLSDGGVRPASTSDTTSRRRRSDRLAFRGPLVDDTRNDTNNTGQEIDPRRSLSSASDQSAATDKTRRPSKTANSGPKRSRAFDQRHRCFDHGCNGRAFSCQENYRRHIREKTESKPALCDLCGKSFTRKSNRDLHIRRSSCKSLKPPQPQSSPTKKTSNTAKDKTPPPIPPEECSTNTQRNRQLERKLLHSLAYIICHDYNDTHQLGS